MTPRLLRRTTIVRWGVALGSALLMVASPAAHAANGIDVASTGRYVLDEKQEVVRASLTVTVRNEQPSIRQGNFIRYFFLPSLTIPIPADADQLTATSNGSALSVTRVGTRDPSTDLLTLRFPSNLLYGQSRTIDVRFVLKGKAPRSADLTRVGPGYATFSVYGPGDAGQNTIEVVLPKSMTFDATNDLFKKEVSNDTVTYTATENNDSLGFWAVISARDPSNAKRQTVTIGDTAIEVSAYRDDPKWLKFVTARMTEGVPILEELIGTPWPGGLETVREDPSVNLRGYEGWFDPGADEIVIGEELDAETLYHELTHAWATSSGLESRWISEGIAQVLAAETLTRLGGKPRKMITVSPDGAQAVPLNLWFNNTDRAAEVDDFGYPASYIVMDKLLDSTSEDKRSLVLAAAVANDNPYAVEGETILSSADGWQRFLDILELVGDNKKASDTFSQWVVIPEHQTLLESRNKTLKEYLALDEADGEFKPPLGLRKTMTNWDFFSSSATIADLQEHAALALEMQEAAQKYDFEIPEAVVALYQGAEGADEYDELATTLPQAVTAIEAVGKASQQAGEGRNPFASLGAVILDLDDKADEAEELLADAQLKDATAAAKEASDAAGLILWVGLGVVVGGLALIGGLWLLIRRRGRRKAAQAAEEVAQEESAVTEDPASE